MNIRLLKKFNEEFNNNLRIKFNKSEMYGYLDFKTLYSHGTIITFIYDIVNNAVKEYPDDKYRFWKYIENKTESSIKEEYYAFLKSKIAEYKEKHPYRGFKIKVKLVKSRKR